MTIYHAVSKNRNSDWPKPPGFVFANAQGTVAHSDFDELMGDYEHLVFVQLDKVDDKANEYKGVSLWFFNGSGGKKVTSR